MHFDFRATLNQGSYHTFNFTTSILLFLPLNHPNKNIIFAFCRNVFSQWINWGSYTMREKGSKGCLLYQEFGSRFLSRFWNAICQKYIYFSFFTNCITEEAEIMHFWQAKWSYGYLFVILTIKMVTYVLVLCYQNGHIRTCIMLEHLTEY